MSFLNNTWDDIFKVLSALGALGTFGAFLLLFRKDKDKQKQINLLSKLAEINEKRLKSSVAPALWLNGADFKGAEKRIYVDLNNKGERAILKEFNLLSGDIELVDKSLPFDLEKGEQRYIHAVTNNIHPKDASYEIEVLYEDVIQTQFRMIIGGKGERARIISNHEVG